MTVTVTATVTGIDVVSPEVCVWLCCELKCMFCVDEMVDMGHVYVLYEFM